MKISRQNFARFSLALVYVWFGLLKLAGLSPAEQLVHDLFENTLSGLISFPLFYSLFSLFEVLLGVMFLIPRLDRFTKPLFALHILATAAPLLLLPQASWYGPLVLTLSGQYIVKNICLVALVLLLGPSTEATQLPTAAATSPVSRAG